MTDESIPVYTMEEEDPIGYVDPPLDYHPMNLYLPEEDNRVKLMNGGDVVWEGTMPEYANAVEKLSKPITDPRRILLDVDGKVIDQDELDDAAYALWYEDLYLPTMEFLCTYYGHEIVDDQCGLPEHRYCMYCEASG